MRDAVIWIEVQHVTEMLLGDAFETLPRDVGTNMVQSCSWEVLLLRYFKAVFEMLLLQCY